MKESDIIFYETFAIIILAFGWIMERKDSLFYKERYMYWKEEYFSRSGRLRKKKKINPEFYESGKECPTCRQVEENVFSDYCSHCKCQF